jgi:hypothetical protein
MPTWFVFGLLALSVSQPVPQHDGQSQEHQATTREAAGTPAASPAPRTLPAQPFAEVRQGNTQNEADNWRNWFWPPIWSNWFLAAVGIGAIWVALRTLRVIERQTKATEIAAQAAEHSSAATEASVEALINSERAWIMTTIVWTADVPNAPAPTQLRVIEGSGTNGEKLTIDVCLICKNDGKTPAWITKKCFHLGTFRDLPSKPDTRTLQTFGYSGPEPLSVGESCRSFMQPECDGIRPEVGGPGLILYGVVKYRDAFGDHETWCGYAIVGEPPRLERWAGYPEYNKST